MDHEFEDFFPAFIVRDGNFASKRLAKIQEIF